MGFYEDIFNAGCANLDLAKIMNAKEKAIAQGIEPVELRIPPPSPSSLLGMRIVFDPTLKPTQFRIFGRRATPVESKDKTNCK